MFPVIVALAVAVGSILSIEGRLGPEVELIARLRVVLSRLDLDRGCGVRDEVRGLTSRLMDYADRPAVVQELIRWLDISLPPTATPPINGSGRWDSRHRPKPNRDNPTLVALIKVGPVAAPQLVDEYVKVYQDSEDGFNHLRLALIRMVVESNRLTASKAVWYAVEKYKDEPANTPAWRASNRLIEETVRRFRTDRDPNLFPENVRLK